VSGLGEVSDVTEPAAADFGLGGAPAARNTLPGARVDKWLWAVRVYKTRTAATDACRAGHVKVNRVGAKPASVVRPGDTVEAFCNGREHVLEVTSIIEKRVGASVAMGCYVDHSPPPPPAELQPANFARDRGTGRPTKRDRRQIDRVRHK
jgi:ribosome-associated heat shock protein Hsp15